MASLKKWSRMFGPSSKQDYGCSFISKSHKLFLELGLARFNEGMSILSPFLVRSLRKLERIVHKQMDKISALEIMLPTLTNSNLLKISGRSQLSDLFVTKNDNNNYILSPTYEESVTSFLGSSKYLNHSHIPCRLYQISRKYRDEKRAKSGLLRSKEFIMKDLYCFNANEKENEECYKEVLQNYKDLFSLLKLPYVCAKGCVGDVGGLYSHEFHFISDAGEDNIVTCQDCGHIENGNEDHCLICHSNNVKIEKGIEVAHTFNLGTRYTDPFKISFLNQAGKPTTPQMGCFGLGLTRLLAASVEILSSNEEIKWPLAFSPYLVCVVPPKQGSNEEKAAKEIPEIIYQNLSQCFGDDVIFDDRSKLSIGRRVKNIREMGIPFVVVIGKKICETPSLVEVLDVYSGDQHFVQVSDVGHFILNKLLKDSETLEESRENLKVK